MIKNIKTQPKGKKFKEGSLTKEEQSLAKGLLGKGYRAQDVTFIINQGRVSTINQARISDVIKDTSIVAASAKKVDAYLKVQASYNPRTLLNPYKNERLIRAREAMICAVQVFNNPSITFKTETFCVMANIAWTYLMHEKMEKTAVNSTRLENGNSVTVSGTLGKDICPIKEPAVIENLKKIIEIRDAVEHTMFNGGDECFAGLFQSCCLNFEKLLVEWFGEDLSLSNELSLALQFVKLNRNQIVEVEKGNLPPKIKAINQAIQTSKYSDDNAFQLNVFYTSEVTGKSSADLHRLITHSDDALSSTVSIKRVDMTRVNQSAIIDAVRKKGFKEFNGYEHQLFWNTKWKDASTRNLKAKEYGELLGSGQWYWFLEKWLPLVINYCEERYS